MTTIELTSHVIGHGEGPFTLPEDQQAAVAFLARYRGPDPGFVPPRSACPVPVGRRSRSGCAGGDPHPPGAVPELHGGTWPGSLDHRPAPFDRVRVLPFRPHRWAPSPSTRPSTCAAPPSNPPSGAVSTGASWPASC
jgi:hypothetical protein